MNKLIFAIWCCMLVAGMVWISDYSTRPAKSDGVLDLWPEETTLRCGGDSCLLLFVHPRCPCTRATLRQLEKLSADTADAIRRPRIVTLCYCPDTAEEGWAKTDIWESASALGEVILDPGGEEAGRFGISTSGHIILFDHGVRIFDGGITAGRGHEGEPPALTALIGCIRGRENKQCAFPVYGCGLFERGIEQ
ncbi:MAG: hypothetical protein AAF456_03500 [Planctomycetota bacterium]